MSIFRKSSLKKPFIKHRNRKLKKAATDSQNNEKNFDSLSIVGQFSAFLQRSTEWRNELALYKSGLEICPTNAKIHYNIAKIMAYRGDVGGAAASYADAIR